MDNEIAARVDDAISEGWSDDELTRLAHLRSQDRAYAPEPTVLPFTAGMRLSPTEVGRAFVAWQGLRAAPRAGDVSWERAFAELTLLLAWRAAVDSDPYRERGLLESALGLVRAPRYAQMLRATLAVLAGRMGDLQGAESWLRLCDARSADLRADSYYRFARAYLDTAAGNLSRVLSVLGGNDVEVPAVDELMGPTALLRANAWERLDRHGTAVDLLVHYKFEGNPFGQQLTRSFLAVSPVELCPKAEAEAERQRQLSLGRRRVTWGDGIWVLLGIAVYFAIAGVVQLGYGLMLAFDPVAEGGGTGIMGGFVSFFVAVLMGAVLLLPLRRVRRDRALLAYGEVAPARVLPGASVSSSGAGSTDFSARVWVVPDRAPPFVHETTIGSSSERYEELAAGKPFTVRYLGTDFLMEPSWR